MADAAAPQDLATIGADIDWPDHVAGTAAREQLAASAVRYGRLVELAEWLAAAQGNGQPKDLTRPRGLILSASSEPEPSSGIPELLGVGLRIVAVPDGGELSPTDVQAAVAAGAAIADEEVDSGADLLSIVLTEEQTAALAVVAVLTNTEPVKVLARGAEATEPDAWMQRAQAVRDARRRGFAHRFEPDALLAAIGTAQLATAAGLILQASVRRTPLLLDGLGAVAAALLAYEAQPRAVRWWRAADGTAVPAHELALTRLGLRPILDLQLGLVDGTPAALAVPVLRAAIRALGGVTG